MEHASAIAFWSSLNISRVERQKQMGTKCALIDRHELYSNWISEENKLLPHLIMKCQMTKLLLKCAESPWLRKCIPNPEGFRMTARFFLIDAQALDQTTVRCGNPSFTFPSKIIKKMGKKYKFFESIFFLVIFQECVLKRSVDQAYPIQVQCIRQIKKIKHWKRNWITPEKKRDENVRKTVVNKNLTNVNRIDSFSTLTDVIINEIIRSIKNVLKMIIIIRMIRPYLLNKLSYQEKFKLSIILQSSLEHINIFLCA